MNHTIREGELSKDHGSAETANYNGVSSAVCLLGITRNPKIGTGSTKYADPALGLNTAAEQVSSIIVEYDGLTLVLAGARLFRVFGGDSLKRVKDTARMRRDFGTKCAVRSLSTQMRTEEKRASPGSRPKKIEPRRERKPGILRGPPRPCLTVDLICPLVE
ncbi:RING-type E3 ubiquitin transferase [Psidium guajava]|nr:RING-type E3 ubiquitin transferase [Psidium guajava]